MRKSVVLTLIAVTALSACTSSKSGRVSLLSIGTTDPSESANGLAFADGVSTKADIEGEIAVKVVRALTDWDSGETTLVISDETLTVPIGDATTLDDITITLGGETLVFAGGNAPVSSGQDQDWVSYVNQNGGILNGSNSVTGAFFTYEYSENPGLTGEIDSEAFYVFGYETDPDEIAALVGSAEYLGAFQGFGQVIDPVSGDVVAPESDYEGSITITANFDTGKVDGDLDGMIYNSSTELTTDFTTGFSADIEGNGYAAYMDEFVCVDATCTSDSQIGGAFFGQDATETTGILAMDVVVDPDGEDPYRLISGGHFAAQD